MRRLSIALVPLSAVTLAFGFTSNTWQPVDGVWNGDYSDVRHWSQGHLPDSTKGDDGEDAIFPTTDDGYVVRVDVALGENGVPMPQFIKIGDATSSAATDGFVKFVGTGSLQLKQNLIVESCRKVCLGGSVQLNGGAMYLRSGSTIKIDDEFTYPNATGSWVDVSDGVSFNMVGGRFCAKFRFSDFMTGSLAVSGGWLEIGTAVDDGIFPSGLSVSFTGGTIEAATAVNDVRFVPQGNARLICHGLSTQSVTFGSAAPTIVGDIVCTNAMESGLRFDDSVVACGGEWTVGWFLPYSDTATFLFGISRLNIGQNYFPKSGAKITYPTDITIGCWGGAFSTQYAVDSRFLGSVTFDSTDVLDGVTGRDFRFAGLVPSIGSALRFVGNGSPTFALGASESSFLRIRRIELGENSHASFAKDNAGVIQVGEFRLGAGASLAIDPNAHSFVCLTSPELDATARIILDLANLADSSDGTGGGGGKVVRHVFFDSVGDGISLANFSLVNQPSGKSWTLKKLGGCVYLQDASAVVIDDSDNGNFYLWTGTAEDNDVSNASNWSCGMAPLPASKLHFRFEGTNEVGVPSSGITASQVTFGGYYGKYDGQEFWRRCAPPYRFNGGRITLGSQSGAYNSAIFSYARNPVVFENEVAFSAKSANILTTAPIVFRGDVTAPEDGCLGIGGDVRVAGAMSLGELASLKAFVAGDFGNSALTVLPSGSLTVGQRSSTLSYPISLNTVGGGSMEFRGAVALADATKSAEHLVDGHLVFGDSLTVSADQTFCGTGRVDFASIASSKETPPEFVLAGGVAVGVTELGGVDWSVREGGKATIHSLNTIVSETAVSVRPLGELTIVADKDVTLASPVSLGVAARLIKDGDGRLALVSTENSFAADSEFSVKAGVFAWSGPQALGKLTVAPGVVMESCGDGALTVVGDVSLEGVLLRVRNSFQWNAVLDVPSGCRISGTPVALDAKWQIVDSPSGGQSLLCRRVAGLSIVVR